MDFDDPSEGRLQSVFSLILRKTFRDVPLDGPTETLVGRCVKCTLFLFVFI
jgi:hypothetical protein